MRGYVIKLSKRGFIILERNREEREETTEYTRDSACAWVRARGCHTPGIYFSGPTPVPNHNPGLEQERQVHANNNPAARLARYQPVGDYRVDRNLTIVDSDFGSALSQLGEIKAV